MIRANKPNSSLANTLAHPINPAKAFFKWPMHEWRAGRLGVLTAARTTAVTFLAATMLAIPTKIEAKPGPFYNGPFSTFGYVLVTPISEDMKGNPTRLIVTEIGGSGNLVSDVPIGSANLTLTGMALGGTTRAKGLPPAETNFGKLALTPNIAMGRFTLSPGVRWIWCESLPWSMKAGPMALNFPSEKYVDIDWGMRAKWALKKGEPGFVRSVEGEATAFNVRQTIRGAYRVFKVSVGLPKGIGVEASTETKTGNISADLSKAFVWNRGQRMVFTGAGYEFGTKAVCGYVGGMVGPAFAMVAIQSEVGDKSAHCLVSVNPFEVFGGKTGKGK
ncbi:Uncharacterised protein [Candidatus Anstonella stagnisolia]|nr:Uncharacterised protein [Candidatus Anstonella stagnisolia]